MSVPSVQKKLDSYIATRPPTKIISQERHVMIVMDATYFKRICVALVIRDWYLHETIFNQFIPYETINVYLEGVDTLKEQGFIIDGIVVDGRRGVMQRFSEDYPVQMCQFHQKKIVRKYLTMRPETKAGQALWDITKQLTTSDQDWFEIMLDVWHIQYGSFIKERTVNPVTHRWFYTHKRVRSAYRSLRANLPYLFTYQKMRNMPNTTNSLDGLFAHVKDKVRLHRGLKLKRKKRLIRYLIEVK